MNRVTWSWIGMLLAALFMIALIIIYIKKPATDKRVKRARRTAFLVPLAVFAFCAFIAFGEHGGMGFVKEIVKNPSLDGTNTQVNTKDDAENGAVIITVSGRTIDINGYKTDDEDDFREHLSGYIDEDKVEIINDYAVSSAMHTVTDAIKDILKAEHIDWDQDCLKATVVLD